MQYFSKKAIQKLLKNHHAFPKKRFGQNFLIDKKILKKILKAAGVGGKDVILEIGPGIGNLTQELAKNARKVIAVEKDLKMVEILKETAKNLKNVKIIQGDILKLNHTRYKIQNTKYKIVANLPYYIVSPIIRKFLESGHPPQLMVLMVQKEVAQRITARPPHMNLLSVSVQFYAEPEIISYVSKNSFWPQPKVDSAILKISNIRSALDPRRRSAFNQRFFTIAKSGFSQPRKQIANNLSRLCQDFGLRPTKSPSADEVGGQAQKSKIDREKIKSWLLKNKIRPDQRAETLNVQDWVKLAKTFPSA